MAFTGPEPYKLLAPMMFFRGWQAICTAVDEAAYPAMNETPKVQVPLC